MAKEASGDNSFGILSVGFGILSLVFAFSVILGSIAGTILGVLGFIFALVQRKRSKNKWAKTGLVLSLIGVVINVILFIILVTTIAGIVSQYQQQLQSLGGLTNAPA